MWEVDYDGALLLRLSFNETDVFLTSSFYKISLKRFVKEALPGFIRFKPSLTYLDYKRIIGLLEKEAERRGVPLTVSQSLRQYIDHRELHIESRSRLGVELKSRDPKLMERYEVCKKIVDDGMARKLREKQMWDSFFMLSMKKSANFSVPGSGKTASVLGVYAYLKQKQLVKRIVVICPKNAFGSWIDEFEISFRGIEAPKVLNIHDPQYKVSSQRKSALLYDSGKCNLVLVNYEAVGGVVNELAQLVGDQALLVFDEVHKVKRVGGEYAENALYIAQNAMYAVAMTGTPLPNSYTDIYNLLHILFPDEYDEFFNFSIPMLKRPTETDIRIVNDKLQPFFCRTTKDQLGVPPINPDVICEIQASETENRLLEILKKKYRKNNLALLIRILQLESNPQMLLQSLSFRDFAYLLDESENIDEIDYADYSEEVRALIESCNRSSKFERCVEMAASLVYKGKPAIIWCMFVDSIRQLAKALEQRGVRCRCIYGEVSLEDRQQMIRDFREETIQVLLTNPHTLAESVSLHQVCHDAIYFEYSYNLVHLLQSKDRIHRLGLPENQYTQYYFAQLFYKTDEGAWSMEKAVYDRLKEKERIMLDAIDHHVLESMPTDDEDLGAIFADLF